MEEQFKDVNFGEEVKKRAEALDAAGQKVQDLASKIMGEEASKPEEEDSGGSIKKAA